MTPHEFAVLYRRYYDPLFSFVMSRARNRTLAEEVVSEAFVNGWTRRGTLNGNFKSWLFQIAYHRLCERWRTASKWEPIDFYEFYLASNENIERDMELREEARGVAALCDELSQDHQRALAHQVKGMSLIESARRMRVPVGTVLSRRLYAKEKVRDLCRS